MVRTGTPRRFGRRALIALIVLLACCACGFGWVTDRPGFVWALFRDAREYPPTDPFHITKGGLEDMLLPHFRVTLPCDLAGLRYGEWEDFGPMGVLYLRFETSPACLDGFLRDNALERSGRSDHFPSRPVPPEYGWHIDAGNVAYTAQPSREVRLEASVDSRSSRPVVYLISRYH